MNTVKIKEVSTSFELNSDRSCLLSHLSFDKKNGEYLELGRKVICKDYLGDTMLYSRFESERSSGAGVSKLPEGYFAFLVTLKNEDTRDYLIKKSKIINKLEKDSGIPETKFLRVIGNEEAVVVHADNFYMKSSLLTSTLVQLVRCCLYRTNRRNIYTHINEAKEQNGKDKGYMQIISESKIDFKFLFTNIDKILNGNPFTSSIDKIFFENHNYFLDRKDTKVKLLDGREVSGYYSISYNHAYHGISNFCENLCSIKSSNIVDSLIISKFGAWAANYLYLKEGKNE